jgi:hypothetical protein
MSGEIVGSDERSLRERSEQAGDRKLNPAASLLTSLIRILIFPSRPRSRIGPRFLKRSAKKMKTVATLWLVLFALTDTGAGFHYPEDRVPIEIVGVEGKRLDKIQIPEVNFDGVPALDAFRQIMKMVNDGSEDGSVPFEMVFKLSVIEGLSKPINLKLRDVTGTLAIQYITALTDNHFSIHESMIVVFPEPEGGFETKAEQDEDDQATATGESKP